MSVNIFTKTIINFIVIILLTFISFLWTFWIFHKEFLISVVLAVILLRVIASIFIFRDYSASWSRASNKLFLIKTLINFIAFIVYMPFFHGEVRIALLVSELFIFLFLNNLLIYSYQYFTKKNSKLNKKTLAIFGAGQAGLKVASEFSLTSYKLKVFIDDDKKLASRSIDGIGIVSRAKFSKNFQNIKLDLLVIAVPSVDSSTVKKIYNDLEQYASEVKILPSLDNMLLSSPYTSQLKNIDIKDLLARHPVDLDENFIDKFVNNKIILITGAGGTIGSELAKQCAKFNANCVILLDHNEYSLYVIEQELSAYNINLVLLSVIDKDGLSEVFKKYDIDIVLHAAAYKHVPMVEANITQSINNNVLGTKNVIDLAVSNNIAKLVLISTDKAVRPTSIMGATKRICELYAQNVVCNNTKIVAVRFGNVLGSSGSVIPLFEKQIEQGGPITITHPDITRYFMLISEACELVLQAGALGDGSEIFILDMGKPIKILSLAKQMLKLRGADNIEIKYIGLRDGEKLYEELLINDSDKKTSYPSITVAKKDNYPINKLNKDINTLLGKCDKVAQLQKIVPEFKHKVNN